MAIRHLWWSTAQTLEGPCPSPHISGAEVVPLKLSSSLEGVGEEEEMMVLLPAKLLGNSAFLLPTQTPSTAAGGQQIPIQILPAQQRVLAAV